MMRTTVTQESFKDKLSALSLTAKITLIIVGTLFILLIDIWVESQFQGSRLQRAKREEKTLKQTFESNVRRYAELSHEQAKANLMLMEFGKLLSNLPEESQIDTILKNITKEGHSAGISFVYFKPQPEKKLKFYAEMNIKVAAIGNYHQMATFLSNIANMKQLITVHELRINRENPARDVLTMHVTLRVYSQMRLLGNM